MAKKDQMGSWEKGKMSEEEIQEVDKFHYLGGMISMDDGRKGMGDDGKIVEREDDIQRKQMGVI